MPPVPELLSVVARALRAGQDGGPPILLLHEACTGDATVMLHAAARLYQIKAGETGSRSDIAVARTLRALVRALESGDEARLVEIEPVLEVDDDWFSTSNSNRRALEFHWLRNTVGAELGRYVRAALESPNRRDSALETEFGRRIARAFFAAATLVQNRIILAQAGLPTNPPEESTVEALTRQYKKLLFGLNLERRDVGDETYVASVVQAEALRFAQAGYRQLGMNAEHARGLFRFLEVRMERGSQKRGVGEIDGVLVPVATPHEWLIDEPIPGRCSNFEDLMRQRDTQAELLRALEFRREHLRALESGKREGSTG